jgi:HD-GYP domain-containing protein (c-di-GMP phosphodiesterase class II)
MESIFAEEPQFDEKILRIAAATDKFEGYEHAHASRIAAIADALAQKFNLASHDRFSLRQAALVHDVGEVVMNREYFKSSRLLSADERIDMQRHPVIGEQEAAKQGLARAVQLIVRWHHEWWNGSGYPDALAEENIPFAARILRVADTYSALTDARPYSPPIPSGEAKRYLIEWAGIEFDPGIVKVFLSLENLEELRSYADVDETAPIETPVSEEVKPEETENKRDDAFAMFNDFIE